MEYIPKSEIARLLYCLNWHTMDLIRAAQDKANGLSDHERSVLQDEIHSLRELKTQVLRKLVREGHAAISGLDTSFHAGVKTKYYRIRLNSHFSFHAPREGFKESGANEEPSA